MFRKEDVRFPAEGGIELSAWLFIPERRATPHRGDTRHERGDHLEHQLRVLRALSEDAEIGKGRDRHAGRRHRQQPKRRAQRGWAQAAHWRGIRRQALDQPLRRLAPAILGKAAAR